MLGLCRSLNLHLACFFLLTLLSPACSLLQVNYQGVIARQSTDRFGVELREVWEDGRLTQALVWPSEEEVVACEEGPSAPPSANLTAVDRLPPEFAWLPGLRRDCARAQAHHAREKRSAERRRLRHGKKRLRPKKLPARRKDHLAKGKKGRWMEKWITPGTQWCGPDNIASRYAELGPSAQADRCCRAHDQCQRYILGMSKDYGTFNFRPFTLSHCSCDRRFSRSGSPPVSKAGGRGAALVPGTMWCGRGYSATSYKQLGAFAAADRCCRRHDTACSHWIPALSYRYGLYNWRPSTLMHCHCDRRFRTCLKMADTTASNFVGKLFFNLVQRECFVLKTTRMCVERTWWGKCVKTELKKQAHLRYNMAF